MHDDDLAGCLRAWRDRLSPATVGLPARPSRRTPGLRREELAQLSGLSVDYLTRLEQGRARNPSKQVLVSLTRALRLDDEERDHLFRLAGQVGPTPTEISRHLTPGVHHLLDRLTDVPVMVIDASWEMIAWNRLAAALHGEPAPRPGRDRNVIWRYFTGTPSRTIRDAEGDAHFELEAVADLHVSLGRYPDDASLRSLVDDLRAVSERFARLWDARPAAVRSASRKTFEHPEVGRITLDCDVLTTQGSDLRIIVYTPRPGSPDAAALALVGVIGLQAVNAPG